MHACTIIGASLSEPHTNGWRSRTPTPSGATSVAVYVCMYVCMYIYLYMSTLGPEFTTDQIDLFGQGLRSGRRKDLLRIASLSAELQTSSNERQSPRLRNKCRHPG